MTAMEEREVCLGLERKTNRRKYFCGNDCSSKVGVLNQILGACAA